LVRGDEASRWRKMRAEGCDGLYKRASRRSRAEPRRNRTRGCGVRRTGVRPEWREVEGATVAAG
jgi:hypothetical protein